MSPEVSRHRYSARVSRPYRDEAHRRMRDAALDAAAEEVVARGWRGLQVQTVATRVGVSRQTLYKTFGDKHGLSQALVLRHAGRILDDIARAIDAEDSLRDRWAAVVATTLAAAEGDPLVKAVLLSDSSDEFLPLLTSRGAPVLDLAQQQVTALVLARHPELDPTRVATAAEALTRLTLSHLVLPRHPADRVADDLADLATSYLTAGPAPGLSAR